MPGTDRRSSTSSEDATLPPKQILQDGTEFIPTRTAKTGAPKPAANPLQFIKVGPCDLYKAAQEQIKKVEEIKKVEKKVKEDSEDWQSNLDNWKCSRRKIQEHIIDRVAEVKKLELEEHERNRRRGKTLNEMMEERTQKGVGPRKMSLLVYPDDDATDLTDLGISTADKNNGNEDSIAQALTSEDHPEESNGNGTNGKKNGVNGHEISSPEPEEYTYERAIQGYKSFAEKNVKSSSKPRISPPKREPGGRIGEKLNELEQVRLRSNSVTEVQLPKVDIHKRRSLFEVVESAETKSPSAERVARDLGGAKIVKERLSSLERKPDIINSKTAPKITDEISITIKDRLSSLEKQKSSPPRIINEEISLNTFKERLISLDKGVKESNSISDEEITHKDILSPAVSEREVSSPLVSCESLGLVAEDTNTNNGDLVIEGRVEVEVDNKVEIVMKEFEIVVPKVEEDLLPKTDEVITKDEKKTDKTKASESSASEKSSTVRDTDILTSLTDAIDKSKTVQHYNIVPVNNDVIQTNDGEKSKPVEGSNILPDNNEPAESCGSELSTIVGDLNIVPDNMPPQAKAREISKTIDFPNIVPDNNGPSEEKSKTFEDPNIVPESNESSESCVSEISTMVEDLNIVPDNKPPQAREISKTIDVPDNNESSEDKSKTVDDPNIVPVNNESVPLNQNTADTCARKESPIKPPLKLVVNRKVAPTPSLRKRKLTPMLTAPIAVLSPVMSPGELQIISEDFPVISSNNDLTEIDEEDSEEITKPVPAPRGQGAETSESGIDMEESSLYTDENIDEVLGVDDVGDDDEDDYSKVVDEENVPDSAKDLEISRRQMIQERGREDSGYVDFEKSFTKQASESTKLDASLEMEPPCDGLPFETMNQLTKQQEAVTRFDELIGYTEIMPNQGEIMENIKNKEINGELTLNEEVKKPIQPLIDLSEPIEEKQPPPLYENIIIANQMLDLGNPGEILSFPLSPMTSVEPPKEKPPPPPIDLSDEETEAPELPPKTALRRLDSTKRIKKEIRKKRSDFLGIEGANDDAYLEPEVNVEPPPDMMKLLEEERRLDQQLYRQSLSSEADSTENVQIHTNAVDRLEKSLFLDQYYGYRNASSDADLRLQCFAHHSHLFLDKDILDIGCNIGHVTLCVARDMGARSVVGLDIDKRLIGIARKNVRHYVTVAETPAYSTYPSTRMPTPHTPYTMQDSPANKSPFPHQYVPNSPANQQSPYYQYSPANRSPFPHQYVPNSPAYQQSPCPQPNSPASRSPFPAQNSPANPSPLGLSPANEMIECQSSSTKETDHPSFFPISMPILYGPLDLPGFSTPESSLVAKPFPHNVSFVQGSYVLESDALLQTETPQFDVIMCLSVTKWIHLNWGDAGLKRAFRRMFTQLRPGGKLILEPQGWPSYNRKKKLTEQIYRNYMSIELLPDKFVEYLLSPAIGFSSVEEIGAPPHPSKGFRRPIHVLTKAGQTPSSCNTPVCYTPYSQRTCVRKPVYTSLGAESFDDDDKKGKK